MGSIRAFVAIYPSPDELSRCLRLRDAEKALWPSARWVRDDQIHLTLRFFEALEEARLRELIRWLAEAALETCPFRIRLFHRVPPWRGAKVEAISAESPDLDLLARRVEEAARRAGAPPERRPFRGHVTL
ncbi:MAG: 2'-5' RNA ligase family protein, partial [Fimbriimonadales bacterium]